MGIYLSTPSTEIFAENGSGAGLTYSLGEMQGWRRNMEDAHIAYPELEVASQPISVFGVFDGHGGKEVAKFVNLKFAEVLRGLDSFKQADYERALRESFHRIDQMLEDPQYDPLLKQLKAIPNPSDVKSTAVASAPRPIPSAAAGTELTSTGKSNPADDDMLTTSEAVRMIRELLQGAKRQRDIPAADEGAGLPATTSTTAAALVEEGDVMDSEGEHWSHQERRDVEDDFKSLTVESSNLWVQTTHETAVGEVPESHHVTPHVEHDVILLEDTPEPAVAEVFPAPAVAAAPEVTEPPQPVEPAKDMVCRLSEHRVQAGCTAVVALVVGNKLIVANAGDSRGVMSRGGTAVALSEDHKPQQDGEMKRIRGAGGFVNFAGRVNGNLNLSRSLGDLKYKQTKQLPPEAQMITAEPDITVNEICREDEFLLLACDGVWDCLTNQEAVDFVRGRLLAGNPLEEIVRDVLHHCVADDPRKSQGIGGDNMTCLIVDLRGRREA